MCNCCDMDVLTTALLCSTLSHDINMSPVSQCGVIECVLSHSAGSLSVSCLTVRGQ